MRDYRHKRSLTEPNDALPRVINEKCNRSESELYVDEKRISTDGKNSLLDHSYFCHSLTVTVLVNFITKSG